LLVSEVYRPLPLVLPQQYTSVLDLIWGIPTLETADPVVFQDMRTLASLLINGETMACTEKLRVLLQSSLGRTRSVSRLISINLENIPGHLRGRSPASASSAGVSRHSRLRKAWLPWRVSRLGTPPPGWRMTARGRGPNSDPYPWHALPHFLPGKLRRSPSTGQNSHPW
jgi:hypothetical protein